jgi:hypothetical protein
MVNGQSSLVRKRTLGIMGWILGCPAAIWLLGFPVAVPLTLVLYLRLGARERWTTALSLTVLGWISF